MVAVLSLKKDKGPTPLERLCKCRRPGRATLNFQRGELSMKPSQQNKPQKASSGPEQGSWQQMNRKQRREMTRKIQAENLSLEVVHPHAAGTPGRERRACCGYFIHCRSRSHGSDLSFREMSLLLGGRLPRRRRERGRELQPSVPAGQPPHAAPTQSGCERRYKGQRKYLRDRLAPHGPAPGT